MLRRRFRLEPLEGRIAPSITFQFDDSFDTSGFFAANPAALSVLQQAGQFLGGQLHDHLAAIAPGGGNTWTARFFNPSNPGSFSTVDNLSVPADTLVVYVGGTSLGATTLGEGGSGGESSRGTMAWNNLVAARGQSGALASTPTDFSPWGGSLSFDAGTDWSFGGTPGAGQTDFRSVALHELGHVLGFGTSDSWTADVNPSNLTFSGARAEAVYGGPVPVDPARAHWAEGTLSAGTLTIMNPSIADGVRRQYTPLDWAGLADIGWDVDRLVVTTPPPGQVPPGGDFGLEVAIEDPDGDVDTTFQGSVTLSLANNPGGATLGGTTTVTAVDGVARFSGLGLDRSSSGVTFTVSASGGALDPVTAGPIDIGVVSPPATQHLAVTTEPPGSVTAGDAFGLVVAVEDGSGTVDPTFTGTVTLIVAGGAGTTLGGTTTVVAIGGVATFSGLTLGPAGRSVTLQLTSDGLDAVATQTVVVSFPRVTVTPPPPAVTGAPPAVATPVPVVPSSPSPTPAPVAVPPATVLNVSLSPSGLVSALQKTPGKPRKTASIVIQFGAPLDATAAANPAAYSLAALAPGKKHRMRPVAVTGSSYDPVTRTVTLSFAKTPATNAPLQLRLSAASLTDAQGRPLDGNGDGQPGGDYTVTLGRAGAAQ
jgi:hypothetical protein